MFDDPILAGLAENAWCNISTHPHARYVALDEWVAMPNYLHGILMLMDDECKGEVGRKWAPFADGITVQPVLPLRPISLKLLLTPSPHRAKL